MNDVTTSASRSLGWFFLIVGSVVLGGYAIFASATDSSTPLGARLAMGAVLLGLLCLFVSVLRQRLEVRKTERYEDVEI